MLGNSPYPYLDYPTHLSNLQILIKIELLARWLFFNFQNLSKKRIYLGLLKFSCASKVKWLKNLIRNLVSTFGWNTLSENFIFASSFLWKVFHLMHQFVKLGSLSLQTKYLLVLLGIFWMIPCVSRIVAFIAINIDTKILFAFLVGWLNSSTVEIKDIKAWASKYSLIPRVSIAAFFSVLAGANTCTHGYKGHNPWHTV